MCNQNALGAHLKKLYRFKRDTKSSESTDSRILFYAAAVIYTPVRHRSFTKYRAIQNSIVQIGTDQRSLGKIDARQVRIGQDGHDKYRSSCIGARQICAFEIGQRTICAC